jgi:hypothetical protein
MVGSIVREYVYIATILSNWQWNLVNALCDNSREKPALKVQLVQLDCCAMYEPSSPTKESDDE